MKVLLIGCDFTPVNSPRSYRITELTKEFCRRGDDVTLVTTVTSPQIQHKIADDLGFMLIDLGERQKALFPVSTSSVARFIGKVVNKTSSLLLEYPDIGFRYRVRRAVKSLPSDFDLVISVAAPHPIHWGLSDVWARDRKGKIWIADCGDPYYGVKVDRFRKPFYFKYIEQKWCRLADYISIPKSEFEVSFLPEFRGKLVEIPQGFNIGDNKSLLKTYRKHKCPTFLYAGSFVPQWRDPSQFLEYLSSLNIEYRFIIYTRQKHFIEPFLANANGQIEVRDYIDRNDLLGVMSQMDFLINFMYDPYKYAPSKMADYLIADRPILNIDYQLDKEKVLQFLDDDYSQRWDMYDVSRFDISVIYDQIQQLVTDRL